MTAEDPVASRNWSVINQRWPALYPQLREAVPHFSELWLDEDGPEPTLVVDGLHLTSLHDPQAEAELQASLIPESASEIHCYGTGLGLLPQALLMRAATRRLHHYVLNPALFAFLLDHSDQAGWLDDARVELHLGRDQRLPQMPFAVSPPCLLLAEPAAAPLRDRLQLELDSQHSGQQFQERADLRANLEANRARIAQDPDVSELFNRYPNGAISVVAAGPTLDFHYGFLSLPQIIVCVDRALRPLLAHGIRPQCVVAVDPKEHIKHFLEVPEADAAAINLVYAPAVAPGVIEHWPGPRYVMYSASPLYRALQRQHPHTELFLSGSVIHPALDLAVRMGARHLLLFGADFCFPGNWQHATGFPRWHVGEPVREASAWIENWRGERVPTLPNLIGYLRDLEDWIAHHPDHRFLALHSAGARIAGVHLIDFSPYYALPSIRP